MGEESRTGNESIRLVALASMRWAVGGVPCLSYMTSHLRPVALHMARCHQPAPRPSTLTEIGPNFRNTNYPSSRHPRDHVSFYFQPPDDKRRQASPSLTRAKGISSRTQPSRPDIFHVGDVPYCHSLQWKVSIKSR